MVLSTTPWGFPPLFWESADSSALISAAHVAALQIWDAGVSTDITEKTGGKSKVMILFFQSDQCQKAKYLLQLGFRVPVRDVAVVSFQAHLVASPDQMVG